MMVSNDCAICLFTTDILLRYKVTIRSKIGIRSSSSLSILRDKKNRNKILFLIHKSEWDPRAHAHTKGGYLDGEIKLPRVIDLLLL